MTYREKALELLKQHMQMDNMMLIDEICETYKPSLFGALNAPDELEDWDTEIPLVQNKELKDVAQLITISTAHITPEVATMLEQELITNKLCEFGLSMFPKAEYGWMLYASTHNIISTGIKCLDDVINYAKANQCEWLCLDQDGPVIDDLMTYDWENTIELD